jgi:diacylglycerol kinase (ATP)
MRSVAVIAHSAKTLGSGLPGLRRALDRRGVVNPLWCEVPKSKAVPQAVRHALHQGADLIFAWGGDGTVQRCIDVLAGTDASLAILPAGTANLLASNLKIPKNIEAAVDIGLDGERMSLDLGRLNGERFGAMAGAGFDARVIRDADRKTKQKLGRMAYVWAVSRNVHAKPFRAEVEVDGAPWFAGDASCVLIGNIGTLFGGVTAFSQAQPNDGMLDLGVATADGILTWTRTIARTAVSSASHSPFVQVTTARSIEVHLSRKVLYELDGGARRKTKVLHADVEPGAVSVCVPKARLSVGKLSRTAGLEAA